MKLEPANMDGSRRSGCLENTRTDVLTLVNKWVFDPSSTQKVLWLHGPAGSGKSTISTTLADHFRRSRQLGAFLFFDRDVTERSNPALVVPTLAYQLSSFHFDIGELIKAAIESSPRRLISSIPSQFQELLVDPVSGIESLSTKPHIVLIMDGLDECGAAQDRGMLVNALAEKSAHFPSTFRLIITSRPDNDIRLTFESQPHVLSLELDLASTAAKEDILTYFRYYMDIIRKKNKYLGEDWPGKKAISALARRACGLFIWASIACNFIDAHDPRKRLGIILNEDSASTASAALDALYRKALEFAGLWDDEDFTADFRAIIGMILFLRNPVTTTAIDNLLANPAGRPCSKTIEQLGCLLSTSPRVRLIHPSLADFFTNRSRCGRDMWFFTPALHERTLAILCLRRLQVLHRDMSQMSLWFDECNTNTPQDVAYACIFWVDHVCLIKDNLPPIEKLLRTFIDQHILHWFEAMSLLKKFSRAKTLLLQLLEWIRRQFTPRRRKSLVELIRHWWRFCQEYELCIQQDPMQVYSEELLRELQIIEVQEPLDSHPPPLSILDLPDLPQSSVDISSPRRYSNHSISRPVSPSLPDLLDSANPASRSASPDLARVGRRLSRSSLKLPSSRNSSVTRSESHPQDSAISTLPASRPGSPHHGRPRAQSLLNTQSQQPVSLPTSPIANLVSPHHRTVSRRLSQSSLKHPSSRSPSVTRSASHPQDSTASTLSSSRPGSPHHGHPRAQSLLNTQSQRPVSLPTPPIASLVETTLDENTLRILCESDCGVPLLLDRVEQSMVSCQEISVFFKKRALQEEEYGKNLQRLSRTTADVYSMVDGKAGSFGKAWQKGLRIHEVVAENRLHFSQLFNGMTEKLDSLAKKVDKVQKQTKKLAGHYERALQESESITKERKAHLIVASDELELVLRKQGEHFKDSALEGRVVVGDEAVAKGELLIKRNIVGNRRVDHFRVSNASHAYRKAVKDRQETMKEYFNVELPRVLQALNWCADEIDLGIKYYLTQYAQLFERMLLSEGSTLAPPKDLEEPGLKATINSIDNHSDMEIYMQNYAQARGGILLYGPRQDGLTDESSLSPIPSNTSGRPEPVIQASLNSPSTSNLQVSYRGKPTFGVDLAEQMKEDVVPLIVSKCCQAIEKHGITSPKIYHIHETSRKVAQLKEKLDRDVDFVNLDADDWATDINNVAGTIKLWFRELPDPLLTRSLHEGFIDAAKIENDRLRYIRLHERVNELPDPNYVTLKYFMGHLHRVSQREVDNLMTIRDLAIIFGPIFLDPMVTSKIDTRMGSFTLQIKAIQTILEHYSDIFIDEAES